MLRSDATAEESLACMRARNKLGIAMAEIINMIATTIRSSINEKPLAFGVVLVGPAIIKIPRHEGHRLLSMHR